MKLNLKNIPDQQEPIQVCSEKILPLPLQCKLSENLMELNLFALI
jgi:hypothetical protein